MSSVRLLPDSVINRIKAGETIERVFEQLKRAGVFHIAGIRKEVERHDRSRLDVSPEGLTPLELLDRYFKSRDIEAARREELLERAQDIIEPQ